MSAAAAIFNPGPRGVSFRARVLPWAGSAEDEARFRRISGRVLIGALLLCIALPWLPVSRVERALPTATVAQPVKLVLPDLPPPPPAPPVPPPVVPAAAVPVRPAPDPKPAAPAAAAKPQPSVKAAPVQEARNPQPDKPPGEAIDAARRKAAGVGLLAMKDQLAALHDAPVAVQLAPVKPGAGVGTGAGVGVGAGSEAGLPSRAIITSNAVAGGSGGINTSGYSRDTGGGGLAGRATTMVAGVAAGGGGGGGARNGKGDGSGTGTSAGSGAGIGSGSGARAGGGKASRSIEEIKVVFDRNKGAIYAIYNRALREEPGLQGKVVVELKIAPSGSVTECRVVSSELHAPELEAKLLARIRQFDFGAREVELKVVSWPLDFLPS